MTPIQACIEAVAYNHGIDVDLVANPGANKALACHRRLAAYVAHTTFGASADEIAAHFGRTLDWAYYVFESAAIEIRGSRLAGRDFEEAKRRARAIMDRHGEREGKPMAATALLGERETAEARRLRAKGWSVTGLAKRYGVPEAAIAPVIGATWGSGQ